MKDFVETLQKTKDYFSSIDFVPINYSVNEERLIKMSLVLDVLTRVSANNNLLCRRLCSFFSKWKVESSNNLDVKICVISALYSQKPSLVSQTTLAKIIQALVEAEKKIGGPYVNLGGESKATDELLTNVRIAYFLSKLGSLTSQLNIYINTAVLSPEYTASSLLCYYYISTFYDGEEAVLLGKLIKKKLLSNNSPMEKALALSALCNLTVYPEKAHQLANDLIKSQTKNGSWEAETLENTLLQTTFVFEALHKYSGIFWKSSVTTIKSREEILTSEILSIIKHEALELPKELKISFLSVLDVVASNDESHKITLLPYLFAQSIKPAPSFDKEFYMNLGLANLYGWMAYTIFDDFIDDEGDPNKLPIASLSLRASINKFYNALPEDLEYQRKVNDTFNLIDGANSWELQNCRSLAKLPSFGNRVKLAERSMGHLLTPLAVLRSHGLSMKDPSLLRTERALTQYLIARQLDDDLHDWQIDVSKGHVSFVICETLKKLKVSQYKNVEELLPDMQNEFWNHSLLTVCKKMREHAILGKSELRKIPFLKEHNVLKSMLDKVEASASETVTKHKQAQQFLSAYSKLTTG